MENVESKEPQASPSRQAIPDRWPLVRKLLEDALAVAPEKRSEFLRVHCDDEMIRREVEALLEHDTRADPAFLSPPQTIGPREISQPDTPDPLIDKTISTFAIKSVIARGGMGTVYLAEQANPKRFVALKVISAGLFSRDAEKRFAFESQILARLSHASIAMVHEAGTVQLEDRPGFPISYFAMEYVSGAKILTQYADDRRLDIRARLELFLQVCDAIHYGHQKGIIHRDIKPANILVNGDGSVKVIDFGVARATDSDVAATTVHTDAGQLIGTLAYMSPEQCDADPLSLDVRSDVYSLGVVLFELLCRRLPYAVSTTSIYAATKAIKEMQAAKPSAISRSLRGDLETMLLKALEKDRAKRYGSSADLARDIHHFLNREAIEARPQTAWTRAVKWVLRHPVATTSIACILIIVLTISASYGVVYWLSLRPDRLVVDDDRSAVRLLSVSGRELHAWSGALQSVENIVHSKFAFSLIDRPNELGGGRLAWIGFSGSAPMQHARKLCAFDVSGDLDQPIIQVDLTDDGIPIEMLAKDRHADMGYPCIVMSANIFQERPGDEIVAIYTLGEFSQRAICIYDQMGELLYRVWHDGGVGAIFWMSGPHLLIFSGDSEAEKDIFQKATNEPLPSVGIVFALRPEIGLHSRGYLSPSATDGPLRPVWYKYVHPVSAMNRAVRVSVTPPDSKDPARCCRVQLSFGGMNMPLDVWWNINESGDPVGPLNTGDLYNQNQVSSSPKLPRPDEIKLSDIPPSAEFPLTEPTTRSSS